MWEIVDNNGTIHSGTQPEMQLIWDLITRSIEDLESEYRRTYSRDELIQLHLDLVCDWSGDLKLVEIHNTYK